MNRRGIWINAIVFQLAWLVTVGGAARGLWWLGPLVTTAFATYTLRHAGQTRADGLTALIAIVLGFAIDTLWVQSGFIEYAAQVPVRGAAPVWIVALWANFALSLNHSLAWLQSRPLLAVLLGAVGGPLSYFFAARTWHAVTFVEPSLPTLTLLAITWAIVTPLLCRIAERLRDPRRRDPAIGFEASS